LSEESKSCSCERNESPPRGNQNITIPEPILTQDKKFKCPLDQAVYDDRESCDKHCAEEHDVL
jgi:hypothetical protein